MAAAVPLRPAPTRTTTQPAPTRAIEWTGQGTRSRQGQLRPPLQHRCILETSTQLWLTSTSITWGAVLETAAAWNRTEQLRTSANGWNGGQQKVRRWTGTQTSIPTHEAAGWPLDPSDEAITPSATTVQYSNHRGPEPRPNACSPPTPQPHQKKRKSCIDRHHNSPKAGGDAGATTWALRAQPLPPPRCTMHSSRTHRCPTVTHSRHRHQLSLHPH